MPYITVKKDGATPVNLYYEDWGKGKTVILIHGWPASLDMWEYQSSRLPLMGLRCIAYDRRGFGKSDRPWDGYDYTSLARDLRTLIQELDLHDVTLAGFSMGGGEVVRYCSLYDCDRVSKVVLVSSIAPGLLKSDSNPDGVPQEVFDDMIPKLQADRPAFLAGFGKQFFGVSWAGKPVSDEILQWMQGMTLIASPRATIECLKSFSGTDFSDEMQTIKVPALIIHGDEDKTVPIKTAGERAAKMLPNALYRVYEGAPHGLFVTEKEQLTDDIAQFINTGTVINYNLRQEQTSGVER